MLAYPAGNFNRLAGELKEEVDISLHFAAGNQVTPAGNGPS
jgi:hypothetical protein